MRTIYFIVSVIFVISIVLFVASFVYLDWQNHKIYYYSIALDVHDVGLIRIDKYITEDKIIYKSIQDVPFFPVYTLFKSRLTIDRSYALESYEKEATGNGATDITYLENSNNLVSFVSIFRSRFAYLQNIPVGREIFVFEDDNPLTYMPLIDNYNFKRGRSQGFNAITCPGSFDLPPMKRFVTLTSIRDEYLKIDRRKIKAENLILKIRNSPQGSIWVAKSDKSLMMMEIPSIGLRITRKFFPKNPSAREYELSSDDYTGQDVTIKNKNMILSGRLTIPKKDLTYPGVLLIWGSGPQDRRYQGIFTCMADYLARNGFAVLSLDKRGTGSSSGNAASVTSSDIVDDIRLALDYMSSRKEIDPKQIGVIGHAEGAYYAINAANKSEAIKWLVLMSPVIDAKTEEETAQAMNKMALENKWTKDYLSSALRCIRETADKVRSARRSWVYILRRKCFVKKMKEEMGQRPFDIVRSIKIPVLILQGKVDKDYYDSASLIDKTLDEAGNPRHTITYYSYLDHYLSKRINDGTHRIHFEPTEEVLEGIKSWISAK